MPMSPRVAPAQNQAGMSCEKSDPPFEPLRIAPVVGVLPCDQGARRESQTPVELPRQARVRAGLYANAPIGRRLPLEFPKRVRIPAAVVENQELKVTECLPADRLDGLPQ